MSINSCNPTGNGGITVTTREELTRFFATYGGQISQHDRRELLRFYCKEVAKMNKRSVTANLRYFEPENSGDYYYLNDDYTDGWYASFDVNIDGNWEEEYELFANSEDGKKYSIFNTQRVPCADDTYNDDREWEAWRELYYSYWEDAWDYKPLVVKSKRHAKRFFRQADGSFKRDSNRRGGQIRMNKTLCYRREATFDPWLSSSGIIEKRVRDQRYSRYNFKVNRLPQEPKNTCNVGNAWLEYVEDLEWELDDNCQDYPDDDFYQITWDDIDDGNNWGNDGYRSNQESHWSDDYVYYDGWDDGWDDGGSHKRVKFPDEPMNYWFNPWHPGHHDVMEGDEIYRLPTQKAPSQVSSSDYDRGRTLGECLFEAIRRKNRQN